MRRRSDDDLYGEYSFFISVLIGSVGVIGLILAAPRVTALTQSASVRVTPSCSFSASSLNHGSPAVNGQTVTIVADPVGIACNDASGYAVYAIGYSGNSYIASDHTDMLSTISSSHNILTSGTSGASYWKMKVQDLANATAENSYNSFQVIPASFTKVASYTGNTNTGSFTPAYEVYIGVTQPADTYTGKVKYTLVHPNTMAAGTYSINYVANGGTGTMTGESGLYNFEEHTLLTSTLTAPAGGYSFAGWCTVQDQNTSGVIPANDPQTTCTGTSFADAATIPASTVASSGTLNLYAYWNPPMTFDEAFVAANVPKYNNTNYHSIQSLTSSICDNVGISETTILVDVRDNKTYTVAKLNDDNCWMTQNLALDITAVSLANLKGNTNAEDTTLEYLKGVSSRNATNEPNGNYPTAGVSKTWTSSTQSYYSIPMIAVDSTTSGPCNSAYCVDDPTSGQWSSDSVTQVTINNSYSSIAQGKIGVYYNYCAASAGSYCYGNGTSNTGSPTKDPDTSTKRDVKEDICPANWHLPTGDGGEFQALYNAYGNNATSFQAALSTPLSGDFSPSHLADSHGVYGYFWSSTRYNTNKMNCLRLDYQTVTTQGSYSSCFNYNGFSIRCIMSV